MGLWECARFHMGYLGEGSKVDEGGSGRRKHGKMEGKGYRSSLSLVSRLLVITLVWLSATPDCCSLWSYNLLFPTVPYILPLPWACLYEPKETWRWASGPECQPPACEAADLGAPGCRGWRSWAPRGSHWAPGLLRLWLFTGLWMFVLWLVHI